MPYVKKEGRGKFAEHINNVVLTIMRNNVPPFVRAEYFGFFVDRMVNRYLIALDTVNPFNSMNFNPSTRKALEDYSTKLTSFLNRDDPMSSAGDLNYVLSSVWWGICGDHEEVDSASYGFRCVTRGMIEQILSGLNSARFTNTDQQGAVLNLRRAVTARGVLNDVISEMYRRRTSIYEEEKIITNGDIYFEGKLVV